MSVSLPGIGAVFLHVPRTGGTWVKAAVEAAGIRTEHAKGCGSHNLPERYSDQGFRFCFIRHPLAWYESVWHGFHSVWPQGRESPALFTERAFSPIRLLTRTCGEREFPDFIRAVLGRQPGFWTRMCEWYVGAPGVPKVDAVGRQEALASHLHAILAKVGFRGDLPAVPRQAASEGPFQASWDANLRDELLASEATGLRRWYPGWPIVPAEPDFMGETW